MTTAAALAACCVVLFGPLPVLLSRARWPTRAPRSAVLVWQAMGLAGSLATIGAGLAVAVSPLRSSVPTGTLRMIERAMDGHPLAGLGLYEALGLTIATDVALVLSAGLATTLVRTFSRPIASPPNPRPGRASTVTGCRGRRSSTIPQVVCLLRARHPLPDRAQCWGTLGARFERAWSSHGT